MLVGVFSTTSASYNLLRTSPFTGDLPLQEDTMKLQQQLYISFLPYTSADDKIKMLHVLYDLENMEEK